MKEKEEMKEVVASENFNATHILNTWKAEDVKELLESMDSEISRLKKEVEMYREISHYEQDKRLATEKKILAMKTLLEIF